jgi:hypothetical protein
MTDYGLLIEISKTEHVPVMVSGSGLFSAEYAGGRYGDNTFEGLKAQILKAARGMNVRVAVPFTRVYSTTFGTEATDQCVATGIHAKNGNLLYRDSRGKSQQDQMRRNYGGSLRLQPMTPEEVAEYERLQKAKTDAKAAYDNFVREHEIDIKAAIKAAQERGSNEAPEK